MKRVTFLVVCNLVSLLSWTSASTHAAVPSPDDLKAAVNSGQFDKYSATLTAWLNSKVPADANAISEAELQAFLDDPAFTGALAQRQFIAKAGAGNLGGLVKEDPQAESYQAFLAWVLQNTAAMENCLEGVTPVALWSRAAQTYSIPVGSLRIWKSIYEADPESRQGIYLKLAIATGQSPPGTGNQGAGQAKTPPSPIDRYLHFKSAHKKGELFPSFDNHSVWDYRQIVSSNASNEDLAWAREAINTWRPDLKKSELVVNSTSEVWRRFSPFPFEDTFKNVLAGGGKCGPRSSWAVFVCQAHGIPAIGVRQPGHACAAYKSSFPQVQPQPGNVWKVVYGRDWHVSKTAFGSGPDFMSGIAERLNASTFTQTERLRWLASALDSNERSDAVMKLAATMKVPRSLPRAQLSVDTNLSPDPVAEPPIEPMTGVIHIEAESFRSSTGVEVHDCQLGGKQVYSPKYGTGWGTAPQIEYGIDVPAAGRYLLTMRVAVVNFEQSVHAAIGSGEPIAIQIPNTRGLWATTPTVEVQLQQGGQTLTLTRPASQRGLALRYLELKAKK